MISDFSEAATFILQKLPQFGTFLEIAKILTKILPQFGMSVLSQGCKNFAKNFAPVWMLDLPLRCLGVLFSQCQFNNQIYPFAFSLVKRQNLALMVCVYAELMSYQKMH
jgi:hypothetical protein